MLFLSFSLSSNVVSVRAIHLTMWLNNVAPCCVDVASAPGLILHKNRFTIYHLYGVSFQDVLRDYLVFYSNLFYNLLAILRLVVRFVAFERKVSQVTTRP